MARRPHFWSFAALSAAIGCAACTGDDGPDVAEVRADLVRYVSEVTKADGFRYSGSVSAKRCTDTSAGRLLFCM